MRLFVAIPLNTNAIKKLEQFQLECQEKNISGVYAKPVNFHLTLAYLGNQSRTKLDAICQILDQADLSCTTLHCEYLDHFKSLYFAGFQKDLIFIQQVLSLKESFKQLGIYMEDQPYTPHITLIRKCFSPKDDFPMLPYFSLAVNQIVLYQSTLTKDGPIYTPLYTRRLK